MVELAHSRPLVGELAYAHQAVMLHWLQNISQTVGWCHSYLPLETHSTQSSTSFDLPRLEYDAQALKGT